MTLKKIGDKAVVVMADQFDIDDVVYVTGVDESDGDMAYCVSKDPLSNSGDWVYNSEISFEKAEPDKAVDKELIDFISKLDEKADVINAEVSVINSSIAVMKKEVELKIQEWDETAKLISQLKDLLTSRSE